MHDKMDIHVSKFEKNLLYTRAKAEYRSGSRFSTEVGRREDRYGSNFGKNCVGITARHIPLSKLVFTLFTIGIIVLKGIPDCIYTL